LAGAGEDQDRERVGDPTGRGRRRQHRQPAGQHPSVPEQVTESAAEHQQARDGDAVGDHDPLQTCRAHAQLGLDGGKRDVDDREVDHRDGDDTAQHG